MKFLKQLFAFYINSSIHVALAVLSLVMVSCLEFDVSISIQVWFFLFFGTITGYNFVKYAGVAGLHHRSLAKWLKTIQVFSFISGGILCFLAWYLSIETVVALICFGLVTILYAVPFIHKQNLRMLGGLKIFIVALVWAGCTVIIPLVASKYEFTADAWVAFTQRILWVLVLILPFEIRDLKYDAISLKTIPQQLGIKKTKLIGIAMLLLILILEGFKDVINILHFYTLLLVCFLAGWALLRATKNQSEYGASFWVEGISIVYGVVFLLLQFLLF